jgi:hypothetical protein
LLSLLAVLVRTSTEVQILTNLVEEQEADHALRIAQFTCLTSTKVQILTNLVEGQEADHALRIAHFAISAIDCAQKTPIDVDNPALGNIHIRVGFHSGPGTQQLVKHVKQLVKHVKQLVKHVSS